ncbi:MAG: 50S ribosomal protein L28 [Candidatus Aminicenantes bacterium]
MAKICEKCGKGAMFGHSVSHSHKASKKKWNPNLQRIKIETDSGPRKVWVCAQCIRSGKIKKAV